jgi:hypothetical protein
MVTVAVASASVVVLMVRSVVVVRASPNPDRDDEPPRIPLPHELFAKELALLATGGITPEAEEDTKAADGDDAKANRVVTAAWRSLEC